MKTFLLLTALTLTTALAQSSWDDESSLGAKPHSSDPWRDPISSSLIDSSRQNKRLGDPITSAVLPVVTRRDDLDPLVVEAAEQKNSDDDGFAAASGKCGDVTTQKIGDFYYHSDGGVTQKIGNFYYGPDGQVTQKIGDFYYHSDGTTTQKIGDFYYDSDGGVTQKIGNFYYHSGGEPCQDKTGTDEP